MVKETFLVPVISERTEREMRDTAPRVALLLAVCALVASSQIYKWNTIQFQGLTRNVDTIVDGENVYHNEESVVMTGAHYDVDTGFVCAAFPRVMPSVPVTVGCFSTDEYDQISAPKFTPFPSVADNDLPVQWLLLLSHLLPRDLLFTKTNRLGVDKNTVLEYN